MRMRWAVHNSGKDWYPIMFKDNCERTFFDRQTGEDESLMEVKERLEKAGYELVDESPANTSLDKRNK